MSTGKQSSQKICLNCRYMNEYSRAWGKVVIICANRHSPHYQHLILAGHPVCDEYGGEKK